MLDAAPGVGIMLFMEVEETVECGCCLGTMRCATDCSRCSNVLRSAYSSLIPQTTSKFMIQQTCIYSDTLTHTGRFNIDNNKLGGIHTQNVLPKDRNGFFISFTRNSSTLNELPP